LQNKRTHVIKNQYISFMKPSGQYLKQTIGQKQKFTMRTIAVCSIVFFAVASVLFVYFNVGTSNSAKATTIAPSFTFMGPAIYSGTGGTLNCVYKFSNVLNGVDAYITITDINNGATLSSLDIPQASTGYENAFQPYVNFKAGTSASPQTSYLEWRFEFKKAGTLTDTILPAVSVTAIDIDGNSSIVESVSAPRPDSYATFLPTQLNISQNATTLTATGPTSDFGGIDSSNRQVMFQMNFYNINDFVYRTVGINKSSAVARQFSIYFKTFFVASPLPVELIKFTGDAQDNSTVNLTWTTASEINNDYFSVERSRDGINFQKTGTVKGNGTTSIQQVYNYIDKDAPSGMNYYRLTQTDFNGKSETFKPIVVRTEETESVLTLKSAYPNPFNSTLTIEYVVEKNTPVKISVLSDNGMVIKSYNEQAVAGTNTKSINALDGLPKGQFIVTLSDGANDVQTKKVMKQ
jgi:Secretion system C-terminal sorting domain